MDTQHSKIVLRDVQVAARVGLAAWERETPQLLTVTVELYAGVRDYLGHVTPTSIINYCRIYDFIRRTSFRFVSMQRESGNARISVRETLPGQRHRTGARR
jgi:hypothetical protein